MPTQTGSIDLASQKAAHDAAAQVATNYVTDLTNGAFVHPEGDTSNGVQITNKVEIIRGGDSVAEYGDTVRIGESTNSHIEMDFNSLEMKDKDNDSYFTVADMRGADGYANIVATFEGDGVTDAWRVSPPLDNNEPYTVTVSDGSGGSPNAYSGILEFSSAPSNGAIITLSYRTSSEYAKYFTIGTRYAGSTIGGMSTAIGRGNSAEGFSSVAIGAGCTAKGDDSTAIGYQTIANSRQTVIGKFNQENRAAAFIVGNGTAPNDCSNAFEVGRSGLVTMGGTAFHDMFVFDTKTESSGSISGGSTKWVTVTCSKTGYKLLGVVGYYINGSTVLMPYALRRSSDTECQMAVRNTSSSSASATIEIVCLYVKVIS